MDSLEKSVRVVASLNLDSSEELRVRIVRRSHCKCGRVLISTVAMTTDESQESRGAESQPRHSKGVHTSVDESGQSDFTTLPFMP